MDRASLNQNITLAEKASLCSGHNAVRTKEIVRLNVPTIIMCDGPHGLRKPPEDGEVHGPNASLPATCFPAACATACS